MWKIGKIAKKKKNIQLIKTNQLKLSVPHFKNYELNQRFKWANMHNFTFFSWYTFINNVLFKTVIR